MKKVTFSNLAFTDPAIGRCPWFDIIYLHFHKVFAEIRKYVFSKKFPFFGISPDHPVD